MSTHNICFHREIRNKSVKFRLYSALSGARPVKYTDIDGRDGPAHARGLIIKFASGL